MNDHSLPTLFILACAYGATVGVITGLMSLGPYWAFVVTFVTTYPVLLAVISKRWRR